MHPTHSLTHHPGTLLAGALGGEWLFDFDHAAHLHHGGTPSLQRNSKPVACHHHSAHAREDSLVRIYWARPGVCALSSLQLGAAALQRHCVGKYGVSFGTSRLLICLVNLLKKKARQT